MTINLEDWVGKKVKVTLENCMTKNVTIYALDEDDLYQALNLDNKYHSNGKTYIRFSDPVTDSIKLGYSIIKIEEIQMNTKELQAQIEETQKQLSNLQEKLKEAEKQEMDSKDFYPCFEGVFIVDDCLNVIDNKVDAHALIVAFDWEKTPQGFKYWAKKSWDNVPLSNEDKITILRWCVNYYRSQG